MAGRKLHWWTVILVRTTLSLHSQIPADAGLSGWHEEFLYREGSQNAVAESMEAAADRASDPLDLNNASEEELESSGIFKPYQIHQLIRYREQYGPILSIHELSVLPGFQKETVRKLSGLITTLSASDPYPRSKKRVWLFLQGGATLPVKDSLHEGSPLKTCLRIRASNGHRLSLAATFQKDAGEPFFSGGRPEHLSGYLQFRGHGIFRQVLAGTYKLHHGLCLVNGTGFMHSPAGYLEKPPVQAGLVPYRSTAETSFDQGLACRLAMGSSHLTCWASCRKLDLSTHNIIPGLDACDWMEHTRESGLHRTKTEIAGRGLLLRFHSGLRFTIRTGRLTAGLHGGWERSGLTSKGLDSLRYVLPLAGYPHSLHHLGLFGQWWGKRTTLFGELATSGWYSMACLAGIRVHFSDFLQGQFLFHRYGTGYRGAYPAAYGAGSKVSAEQGIALHLHAETGLGLTAQFTLELYSFTAPRHRVKTPSFGYRYRLAISGTESYSADWQLKWTRQLKQTTPEAGHPGTDPMVEKCIDRIELGWSLEPLEKFLWRYRLIGTFMNGGKDTQPGWAASQEATLNTGENIKIRVQWVAFRTGPWEKRIYLYQPGLYYSFHFPVCHGTGQRFTLVSSWKPGRALTLSAAVTRSAWKDPERAETRLEIQARWRF